MEEKIVYMRKEMKKIWKDLNITDHSFPEYVILLEEFDKLLIDYYKDVYCVIIDV